MITNVLSVTLYTVDGGDCDRFKVTTVEDGKVLDVTLNYEVLTCESDDGRRGFAVVPSSKPYETFTGTPTRDEDPRFVVLDPEGD